MTAVGWATWLMAEAAPDPSTPTGLNYTGIAALVTAVSGLLATIGAFFLGLRKRETDVNEELLRLVLERQTREAEDETPAPRKRTPPRKRVSPDE